MVPNGKVFALTATASRITADKIMKHLGMSVHQIRRSPNRENVYLSVLTQCYSCMNIHEALDHAWLKVIKMAMV